MGRSAQDRIIGFYQDRRRRVRGTPSKRCRPNAPKVFADNDHRGVRLLAAHCCRTWPSALFRPRIRRARTGDARGTKATRISLPVGGRSFKGRGQLRGNNTVRFIPAKHQPDCHSLVASTFRSSRRPLSFSLCGH